MMTFRPATPSDIPALLALIRELAAYEHLSHACTATEDALREHLFGPRPAAETLVAEIATAGTKSIVAYAIFFTTFSTFLARPGIFLEDLYVQPAHRRQGLGKALLQHLAHLALQRGCARLEWSVLNWNAPALAFYQSLGAAPLSDWTMMRLTGPALQSFAAS
jgi:GNAT superfamily N-acetyltransferase